MQIKRNVKYLLQLEIFFLTFLFCSDCWLFFWYASTKLSLKNCYCACFSTMCVDGPSQMTGWPFRSTGWPVGHPVNMLGEAGSCMHSGDERRVLNKPFCFQCAGIRGSRWVWLGKEVKIKLSNAFNKFTITSRNTLREAYLRRVHRASRAMNWNTLCFEKINRSFSLPLFYNVSSFGM